MSKKKKPGRRKNILWLLYYLLCYRKERFRFRGQEYPYFYHWYNRTWRNERVVELPIIKKIWDEHPSARVLEVGNVTSHYFGKRHDILDKYEKGPGVWNKDVVDFQPDQKYDLILCISTLEHVGWDDPPRDPNKPIEALANLMNCLKPGGLLVATIPLGYNPEIDQLLFEGKLQFDTLTYIKRISLDNRWQEVVQVEVLGSRYNHPYPAANALAIGITKLSTLPEGRAEM
jgi:SAM-dependent methyltransferase